MVRAMLCATHDRTSDAGTSRRTRVDDSSPVHGACAVADTYERGFMRQVVDDPAVADPAQLLAQVIDQDVIADDAGNPAIRQGVARDRVVSHFDPEMRHGRKSASRRFDGNRAVIAEGPRSLIR
jgi:hypothetical protein